MALVQTARLLASSGETTSFTVLVDWVNDPVDARITADGFVLWVDEDDLKVLIGGVGIDPVRVEYAEVGAAAADTLFSGGSERALVFQLIDTLVGGLAIGCALWSWSLAATTANSDAVDDIALFRFVA